MRPGALDIEGGKICREERPSPSVANGAATRSPHRADALSQHFIFLLILTSVASQSPRRRLHASHGLWAKIEAAGEVKSRGRGEDRRGGRSEGRGSREGRTRWVRYDCSSGSCGSRMGMCVCGSPLFSFLIFLVSAPLFTLEFSFYMNRA